MLAYSKMFYYFEIITACLPTLWDRRLSHGFYFRIQVPTAPFARVRGINTAELSFMWKFKGKSKGEERRDKLSVCVRWCLTMSAPLRGHYRSIPGLQLCKFKNLILSVPSRVMKPWGDWLTLKTQTNKPEGKFTHEQWEMDCFGGPTYASILLCNPFGETKSGRGDASETTDSKKEGFGGRGFRQTT